ncbi:MAG: tetratricopeptide repeat protein [Planctomycetota bacterium]|nr:tetratricopeptide repeat protein [Planctomycetota bacterium]
MDASVKACVEKAEACLQQALYAEARDEFQRALSQDQGCEAAREGLARAEDFIKKLRLRHLWNQADAARDPKAAEALYREILRLDPDDTKAAQALSLVVRDLVRPLLEQAEASFQAGRFGDARDEFQQALASAPDCEQARQGVAKAEGQIKLLRLIPLWAKAREAEAHGDLKAAEAHYREILGLNPNDSKATEALAAVAGKLVQGHLERGEARFQGGGFADALDAFQQALSLDPKCERARQGVAQAEEQIRSLRLRHLWNRSAEAEAREDLSAAEVLYRQIVALDPADGKARSAAEVLSRLREATNMLRRGDYGGALRLAKEVARKGPAANRSAGVPPACSKAVEKARFLLGLRWDFWRWLAIAHGVGLLVARCAGPALEQHGFPASDYAWVPVARIGAGALLGFIAFAVGYFPARARRIQESGLFQCFGRPPVPARKA